jgi:hypothetical protein
VDVSAAAGDPRGQRLRRGPSPGSAVFSSGLPTEATDLHQLLGSWPGVHGGACLPGLSEVVVGSGVSVISAPSKAYTASIVWKPLPAVSTVTGAPVPVKRYQTVCPGR